MELRDVTFLDALHIVAELCNYGLFIQKNELILARKIHHYPSFVIRTTCVSAIKLGMEANSNSEDIMEIFKSRGVHTQFITIESLGGDAFVVFGKSESELWMLESIWRLADRGYEVNKSTENSEN
ncbi:MAG: hypothetical protein LAT79_17940 [Kiritimatiellae bacterium]|nr:hypothetical protein [Kiritimatiellia bacterium]